MKIIGRIALAGTVFLAFLQPGLGQTSTNTVVSVVAAEEGLPLLSPEEIPTSGTFWVAQGPRGAAAPWPCLPPFADPIYSIADGQFLVDDTTNDAGAMTTDAITAAAAPILNLIDMEQGAEQGHAM